MALKSGSKAGFESHRGCVEASVEAAWSEDFSTMGAQRQNLCRPWCKMRLPIDLVGWQAQGVCASRTELQICGRVRMMKWVVLTILTSLAGSTLAQTEPATKKKPPAKQEQKKEEAAKPAPAPVAVTKPVPPKLPAIKFSMSMLESGRVDPAYVGFPAVEVIQAIEKLPGAKKGEFESTADYNARRDAALSAKFLDNASVDDVFAFVVPVSKGGKYRDGFGYEFDPDTSDVKLYALPQSSKYVSLNGIGAPDYQSNRRESRGLDQFKLSSKIESSSTYQGSNAYGATVTVEKSSMSSAGIAANRIPFLSFERDLIYSNPKVAAQFKMENSRAAAELPAMKALVVMKLSAPYVVYNFVHKEPKRDSPTEISMQEKYLTGDVLGIVYYSGKSGEIFARLPENFGKAEPKVETKADDKPASQ